MQYFLWIQLQVSRFATFLSYTSFYSKLNLLLIFIDSELFVRTIKQLKDITSGF